jgi:hypothetical protein
MKKLRLGLDSRTVHVGFEVDKEALEQVYLPVLQFSPVSIILPLLHTHSSTTHPRYTGCLKKNDPNTINYI